VRSSTGGGCAPSRPSSHGACHPAPPDAARQLATAWPDLRELLAGDVAARAGVRKNALDRELSHREADDLASIDVITDHMRRTLTDALAEPGHRQLREIPGLQCDGRRDSPDEGDSSVSARWQGVQGTWIAQPSTSASSGCRTRYPAGR